METKQTLSNALNMMTTRTRVIIKSEDGTELFNGYPVEALAILHKHKNAEVDKVVAAATNIMVVMLNE